MALLENSENEGARMFTLCNAPESSPGSGENNKNRSNFFFGIQIMGIVGSYSSPKVAFNIL